MYTIMKRLKIALFSLTILLTFTQVKAQNTTAGSATDQVTSAYFAVKNGLTNDNLTGTKAAAKDLLAAITAVKPGSLSASQKTVWTANLAKLQFDSKHISEAPSIEHQREHFASLSKNMAVVVKGLKSNTAVVYEQYCPMKKASWLSETASVKNPYYGKKMLTCGQVTQTFAANAK
jgi:hypothetical protein